MEFNKENIREIVDPESRDYFKIFAIDGIEKGDDLEYLIIRKMNGSNFGRTYFQFEFPVMNASFEADLPGNSQIRKQRGITDFLNLFTG
ncbi:MAG: hypothetical protein MZV63_11650 [Marinilabiliales bacterium]|nr:hypothetical protein [Marinilabiliales bacterium]